ncbi:MAG: 3D domain-containing protein [Patescibacteria group bacterium]|nr:3D domain-containing protein [Patescibacteria group bacterium]
MRRIVIFTLFLLIVPALFTPTLERGRDIRVDTPEYGERAVPEGYSLSAVFTAYSSSLDETDNTPFITASGAGVRDGIIANNCLPFGTEIVIPGLFDDKVFVVEDRKNSRYGCQWFDIWYSSKSEAKRFGIVRNAEVLVLN